MTNRPLFTRRFGSLFNSEDMKARVDRLLWKNDLTQARA